MPSVVLCPESAMTAEATSLKTAEATSLKEPEVKCSKRSLEADILTRLVNNGSWKGSHVNITMDECQTILQRAVNIFLKETKGGGLLELGDDNDLYYVFGDVHGQYFDLANILDMLTNMESEKQHDQKCLFLGDYVDRGDNSFETIMFLLCWKLTYPSQVFLLRGNHEDRDVNAKYGFLTELQDIFGPQKGMDAHCMFNDMFDHMALAATLYNRYFCVHGGLSPKLKDIQTVADLKLPLSIGPLGTFSNDILWSDPDRSGKVDDFIYNPSRGPKFGATAVKRFFANNPGMKKIIRAHQVAKVGFWQALDETVMTVFSAPNYGGKQSLAATLSIHKDEIQIFQFGREEHGQGLKLVGWGQA